ncbi:hypothetical protein A3J15_00155 [Candidatus Roizmanbacteria bacterium RIFCSPLOWO2_02_FULL_38_10]|uniref:Glycosyltransferase RgtA/B/C/D-like domain-containing protein n=1 Tax=Candidatus Roizmanbacteria bacterium RIFCSPLOWO2_02_FULL_38_10 TaxID=1802074 RepID=A0A1F7JNE9_9BACT|nr:MAG: hypothetical protein A3J15_00155 [Candidatus Roizmanbacteria bacterium RIFCSPLOWO2_02_FULL_38_10]
MAHRDFKLISILLIAFILRIVSLNQSFWLDEAIQATLSTKNPFTLNFANDFQPPLFYLLTALWQKIGINFEWFLRIPSVFFGILTIYFLYKLVKKIRDEKAATLSAFLLATAPFHIYYSQEYRMYSLFSCLVVLSWLLLHQKRRWLFSLVTMLMLYTHYFAFIVIISQFIYLIFNSKNLLKKYAVSTFLSFVPFILWLPVLQKQINTASNLISVWPKWQLVAGVTFLKFPFMVLAKFTVGMISPANKMLYGAIVLTSAIIFIIACFRLLHQHFQLRRLRLALGEPKIGILLIAFLSPLILVWIASLWISANAPHRLLFVLPFFYGILAVGLLQINNKKLKIGLLSLLFLFNFIFSFIYLFDPINHRETWRETISYTDNKIADREVVLTEFTDPWAPMFWYSKKPERYYGASSTMKISDNSINSRLNSILSTFYPRPSTVILYTYLFELSDPNRLVEKYLIDNKFTLTEEKDFRGVGIIKIFERRQL